MVSDRHALALEDLQAHLRRCGVECTVCELNLTMGTVVVHSNSVVDWLLAKSELKQRGLTAVQPG